MHRLILATLTVGILGCGSGDESRPKASSDNEKSASTPDQVGETEVDKLIADGKRLIEEEDYAAAIEAFTQAVRNDDRNANAYRERARAQIFASGYYARTTLLTSGEVSPHAQPERYKPTLVIPQTALNDLKRAILLNPSDAEAHKLKGICLNALRDSDALRSFNEALRLAPGDSDAYYLRGLNFLGEVKIAKADADFTRAIELNPGSVKSLMARSGLRAKIGDFTGSLADLDAVIRLDDTFYSAYLNRSGIHMMTGGYEKAFADCTTAIGLEPNNPDAYSNRGSVNGLLGETSKAIADFSKSIALDPDYVAYGYRTEAYLDMGLFPKALADIDAAIKLAPNVYQLRITRARVLTKMDRPDEARESRRKGQWVQQYVALNKSVTNGPDDPQSYQRRAVHYADDEQWENAISDFNRALQLDSDPVEALIGRAKAWLAQREFQKAINDCDQALKHSSQREIYSVRGDAYLELGDYDRAIADYERTKRFDTQVAQAYLLRSKQRRAAGETSAADKDFQHAIAIDPSLSQRR